MFLGIGNDILEIRRFRRFWIRKKRSLIPRIFTLNEQNYCASFKDPVPRYAARFSAKESVAKALGWGLRAPVGWLDIEIINDIQEKPRVILSSRVQEKFDSPNILLTISHSSDYVSTVAIWVSSSS